MLTIWIFATWRSPRTDVMCSLWSSSYCIASICFIVVVTSADVSMSETSALAHSYKSKFMRQKLGLMDPPPTEIADSASKLSRSLPTNHSKIFNMWTRKSIAPNDIMAH